MTMTSIANGLMESVLERRMEMIRPDSEKSNNFRYNKFVVKNQMF